MDESEQRAALQELYGAANDDQGGLSQAVDSYSDDDGSEMPTISDDSSYTTSNSNVGTAESHLQDVISNLTRRQMMMNNQLNPATGPNRATAIAFLGGMGSGYGSFGTNIAHGMSAAAPYEQHAEGAYQSGLVNLDALRIKAAQAEAMNQYRMRSQANLAASRGMRINENGQMVSDPTALQALRDRAHALENGKMAAQGLDMFGNGNDVTGASPNVAMPSADASNNSELDTKISAMGIHPAVASQLKAVLEGRQPVQGYMLRNPYWQKMLQTANQIDPDFDASTANSRSKIRQDFISGPSSKAINSINTVAGHVNNLIEKADALNNTNWTKYNQLSNYLVDQSGDPRVKEFNTVKNALSSELSKAYKTTGAITQKEKDDWEHDLDTASSPDQFHGVAKTISELLESKINAYDDQWQRGMGVASSGTSFVSPHAEALFKRFAAGQTNEQHDQLPDPSKYKGRMATNSETGEKFQSDGTTWNPVK